MKSLIKRDLHGDSDINSSRLQETEILDDIYPLSYGQQALWLHYQLNPESWAYNVHFLFRICSAVDRDILHSALQELIHRHPILRTTFAARNGQPIQQVHHHTYVPLEIQGISDWSQETLYAYLRTEARRPFLLEQDYPLRVTLLTAAAQDHIFLFVMHHIATDAWTLSLLIRELFLLYEAGKELRTHGFPHPHTCYRDFVQWQRALLNSAQGEQLRHYWQNQLTGELLPLELPLDRLRPARRADNGATFVFTIDEDLTRLIRGLAHAEATTLYTLLLAGFIVLLHCYSHQEDILVGSSMFGRSSSEFEQVAGYFSNLVALRADVSGNLSFQQFLEHTQQIVMDAIEHQDYPFALLVEELQPDRDPGCLPLVNTAFFLESRSLFKESFSSFVLGEEEAQISLGKLVLEPFLFLPQQEGIFDLTLMLYEKETHLKGHFQYNVDLFEEATIARMAQHFLILLKSLVTKPEQRLTEISLLTPQERQQILGTWNQTHCPYPHDLCVHQAFEQQVERSPHALALVCGHEQMSYRELDRRANQLAHALRASGVGPEVLVGLCMERSLQLIVGILAILKAGGVYVPLDPDYPAERLSFMLQDAGISLLLTQPHLGAQLPADALPQLLLDQQWSQLIHWSEQPLQNWNLPLHLAYVIYTSGSTGQPKGVEIPHRGILRLLFGTKYARFDATQRFLHLSSIAFDLATFEVWGALLHGGCCVLFPERIPTPALIQTQIQTHQVTTAWLTASLFNMVIDEHPTALAGLQQLLIGGEALSVSHTRRALDLLSPAMQLINGYGPTESTTFACCHSIHALEVDETTRSIPIGRPISNTQVYVLNAYLQPVPVGMPGELYIGGDGLARGYLRRPDLTAERFIPDPFSEEAGARLYQTGDLVCWRADGTLNFLGRLDHQVKVRGYRVELGEIEAILRQHPAVQFCLVQMREGAINGRTLVAYIVPLHDIISAKDTPQLTTSLRLYLQEHLPNYMIPAHFVILETLPLLPSGKVNYKALPAPCHTGTEMTQVAPHTPIEELVAEIWQHLLGLEQISVAENFFAIGGHSLLAIQIVARIERVFQITFPLQHFFQDPTIAGLALQIERLREHGQTTLFPVLHPRKQHDTLIPLSFAQQRLWFLDQLVPNNPFYNVPLAWHLSGPLDVEALKYSLIALVQRHESLRTSFVIHQGQPCQYVRPVDTLPASVLSIADLSVLASAEQEVRCQQEMLQEAQTPFDLRTDLLLRARLMHLSLRDHILLLTLHHIACDGWSLCILYRELHMLYTAFTLRRSFPLAPLPIQYADFTRWQRQCDLEDHLTYWRRQLADLPILELPTDFPRPAVETFRGACVPLLFPSSLLRQLKILSRQQGVTLFMTLLAAFQIVLMRYSRQENIVVGVPIASRTQVELEDLIGMFVNILVMRTDLSGNISVEELLQRVRQTTLDAYAHQDVPFERLVEELCPERNRERNPLCQVIFQLFNGLQEDLLLPGLIVHSLDLHNATAKADLQVTCWESSQGLTGSIEYNSDLFMHETVCSLLRHFQSVLEAFVECTQQKFAEISLLTPQERQQILGTWNQTHCPYPHDLCVHQAFEQQVKRSPHAPSLVCGHEQMSYRELDRRANQLAHALRASGVGPEVLVGLCMERSLQLIVGMLAILKAGGVYVPLDPDYPAERLSFMLQDAGISLLLTQPHLGAQLPADALPQILLDQQWSQLTHWSEQPLQNWNLPLHLAYVIYTSGSTGQPKGVAIPHQGILNAAQELKRHFQVQSGTRILQWASISFDASLWDIIMALLAGGTLYLPPPHMPTIGKEFGQYLAEQDISIISLTPSALATLPQKGWSGLRTIIVGGEACPLELMRAWGEFRQFYNVYGLTETTIWATVADCTIEQKKMHIGRPIANVQLYVLDEQLQPVPVGVPGALHVGGVGLARCYLGCPELTAEHFIPHPFSQQPGERLYKTGDLVRYLPDGNVEFLGRIDQQVKIRGYRIELEEIKAILSCHPAVRSCLVQLKEVAAHDRRIVAYLTVETPAPTIDGLYRYLKLHLPGYMIPSYCIFLENFPLNANGKVDKNALPDPVTDDLTQTKARIAPRTATEKMLADLWRKVLDIADISAYDDFFSLGGHSLLVAHLATEIQDLFDLLLPLSVIMENSTLEAMAWIIDQQRKADQPPQHENGQDKEKGR